MTQQTRYRAGIYCRLSRDDENFSESESIINQKRMLTRYVEENGWEIYDFYIDDGISGTTFDRPDFLRMIGDIEEKKVNLVITKDLSRLGRNYIETGHFMEVFFPERDVRYIAVHDGIDTFGQDNDIAPFKNILNEMYAKDISKKVRAAFKSKVESGQFIGGFAPYGYKKSPENKNKLVIDECAAEVVRKIYAMSLQGYGLNRIARELNEAGILNPTLYKKASGSAYMNNMRNDKTSYWTDSTIRKMLFNRVYIGILEQGKQRTKSFKVKKRIDIDKNDWVVTENAHEPIIDPETWEKVQRLLKVQRREMKTTGETHLFAGLIVCEDCQRSMALNRHIRGFFYFVCSSYKRLGPSYCSSHRIHYDQLYGLVLNDIKYHAELAEYDQEAIIDKLDAAERMNKLKDSAGTKNELFIAHKRIMEIDGVFKQLYEDKVKGNVSDYRFSQLSRQYEEEQAVLLQKERALEEKMKQFEESKRDMKDWITAIKKYTDIKELDKSIVGELIEKIVIGERIKMDREVSQEVRIIYKFISGIEGGSFS